MAVKREFSVFVQYVLDEWVPPRIRDSKIFMWLPMRILLKSSAKDFMNFKNKVFSMSEKEFGDLYERTAEAHELQGETDLNSQCTDEILRLVRNQKTLEVGCGRGYLANLLSKKNKVTACDIVIPKSLSTKYPAVKFVEGNIENLPFKDNSFETVVCTHTVEHVQSLPVAINELRRVAKKSLIIVVPRQRPYKYTFSLHTQFFPYRWSIESGFGYRKDSKLRKLGDWFYEETNPKPD